MSRITHPLSRPFVGIPDHLLPTMIGKMLHVDQLKAGAVFRLISLTEKTMTVETPTKRKAYTFPRWKAQYTRENEPHPIPRMAPPAPDPDSPALKRLKERCATRMNYTEEYAAKQAALALAKDTTRTYGTLAVFQCPHCMFWHIGRPS